MTTDVQSNNSRVEQFLTFQLAGEAYGVEILKVQEIRGWEAVRVIPNTPAFVKGVLNLRGSVVPIIDLRERFSLEHFDYSPKTVVIVLCVEHGANQFVMGIVADAVSDVLDINLEDIKKAPNFGSKIDTRYMRGMHVYKKKMIMLLDVDKLLNPDEVEGIESLV
ncbi:MAG: chemotaxis protein CheW [Methylobacter sp.]|jgi:CheW-like domain.|uniref:Chemotaxis protein CheW n=2 Tax=Methylobacter tundripaludum TaxID=173365 RepID=G3IYM2_METTV|nr:MULTISPECIES: chemotaxis protein CheW [Methylobacter]EGW20070.1 CheW protein [Methylobacter tundripaludum SV96]MDD4904861.1 chemotaxis protein CheW [Methylobacter tundripaludum]MDO9048105.1 chemotaxis protein CheW [Methylobacter sp.]MDO9268942.1 chemotaxis protein CheW [Methylobacter sp.]MDP1665320.1 chemotaxis protein CheW [Methylobacter sp.]